MKKITGMNIAAVALSVAVLAGCGTGTTHEAPSSASSEPIFSLSETLNLGVKYLGDLDFASAIIQYAAAIDADPQNTKAYAGMWSAYTALGDTENAQKVLDLAKENLGDTGKLIDDIISDAGTIFAGSSDDGNNVMGGLSDLYFGDLTDLDATNSMDDMEKIGNAWIDMDPSNPDAYAGLAALYSLDGNEDKMQGLLDSAEANGTDAEQIQLKVDEESGGKVTIVLPVTVGGETVEVEIEPDDTSEEFGKKVTGSVASSAASEVVQKANLGSDLANSAAQKMANEALQKGLSALN